MLVFTPNVFTVSRFSRKNLSKIKDKYTEIMPKLIGYMRDIFEREPASAWELAIISAHLCAAFEA